MPTFSELFSTMEDTLAELKIISDLAEKVREQSLCCLKILLRMSQEGEDYGETEKKIAAREEKDTSEDEEQDSVQGDDGGEEKKNEDEE